MTPDIHYRLALQIAEHGIDHHEHEVRHFVDRLRRRGHRSPLLDIAVDPSQPAVARERAFGRLPTQPDDLPRPAPAPQEITHEAA